MTFYKGTSITQDGRFKNKDKQLLEKLNFPEEYSIPIHKSKLNLKIIKSWIDKKLNDILGFDDECLTNYIINLIEDSDDVLEPKKIQYAITGFLDSSTYDFMKDFWKLLISAQKTPDGIPRELIEEKKKEIIQNAEKQKEKMKFLEDLLKKNEPEKKISLPKLIPKEDNNSEQKEKKAKKDHRKYSSESYTSSDDEKKRRRHRRHHHRHRSRHSKRRSSSSSSRSYSESSSSSSDNRKSKSRKRK